MKRPILLGAAFVSILVITPAVAIDAPKLPASAKKLTGKEITALYDGTTIKFNNFTMNKPLTGTDTYNFGNKKHSGSYTIGTDSGHFSGDIRVKGDLFCHKEGNGKEKCSSVYLDGSDIYEVSPKGVVESMNQKQ
jgi:hypothetical protein